MPRSQRPTRSPGHSPGQSKDLLLAFYSGEGRDVQGRTHAEILAWSDALLEAVHDYIQWLFPLPEASAFNPTAPVLTPELIEAFRASDPMRHRLRASLFRMLRFYGFTLEGGAIRPAASFAAQAANWLTPHNHNHLRLTRILRSLHTLGLEPESAALLAALEAVYAEEARGSQRISAETLRYWQQAAE